MNDYQRELPRRRPFICDRSSTRMSWAITQTLDTLDIIACQSKWLNIGFRFDFIILNIKRCNGMLFTWRNIEICVNGCCIFEIWCQVDVHVLHEYSISIVHQSIWYHQRAPPTFENYLCIMHIDDVMNFSWCICTALSVSSSLGRFTVPVARSSVGHQSGIGHSGL